MKKMLIVLLLSSSKLCLAQLGFSIQGGYTLPTGPHHSDYQSKLLDNTGYNNSKSFTNSSAFKIDYTKRHLGIGLALEMGRYQTEQETEIIGFGSILPTSSFVAATGSYLIPNFSVQYVGNITKKLGIRTGINLGLMLTGFGKDNGILVVETAPLLGGVVPAQSIGVLAATGKTGADNSSAIAIGGQIEIGYQIHKNLNLHLDWASRRSEVRARGTVLGVEQPIDYSMWIHSCRIGFRYSIFQAPKIKIPQFKKAKGQNPETTNFS